MIGVNLCLKNCSAHSGGAVEVIRAKDLEMCGWGWTRADGDGEERMGREAVGGMKLELKKKKRRSAYHYGLLLHKNSI